MLPPAELRERPQGWPLVEVGGDPPCGASAVGVFVGVDLVARVDEQMGPGDRVAAGDALGR